MTDYEFLFRTAGRGSAQALLSHRLFFYDVAGMEGAEWYLVFPFFLLLGIAILALTLVILAVVDTRQEGDALQTLTVTAVLALAVVAVIAYGLVGWRVPSR
jgi:hypothetical protein